MLYFHLHVYFPVVVTWLVQSAIHSRSIQPNSSFSSIHSIQLIFRLPHSSISRPISTYIRTSHFGCELIVRIRTFCDVRTFGCGLETISSHAKSQCKWKWTFTLLSAKTFYAFAACHSHLSFASFSFPMIHPDFHSSLSTHS